MPPTANDVQHLTRLARYSMSTLRMSIIFGTSALAVVLAVIGIALSRAVIEPVAISRFFGVFCMVIGLGIAWTTYVTGPLARTVLQQQKEIAQLQHDLADVRSNQDRQ